MQRETARLMEFALWNRGAPVNSQAGPGGYDPANVNYGHADRDRRCAAVRWLYVVRVPRQEARNGGITSYNLKI